MRFSWHENKCRDNKQKHDLDFADAQKVFAGPVFTIEDTRYHYNERRWVSLGLLGMTVVVIVHTETEEEIRIISMRKGDKDEQALYFENI